MESERALVLAPSGRDAALTVELLARERIDATIVGDATQLCGLMAESALALIAEEALSNESMHLLSCALGAQPPWSDYPVVIVHASKATPEDAVRWAPLGNVTLLERPVRVAMMLAAVRAGQRARRRQYDARRAIESRDQFLAMLGHELRNPLAAIRFAADSLGRRPGAGGDGARQCAVIDRQTRHLARLVDDLLDVARVTYGKVSLRSELVDLGDVLRTVVQSLEQPFHNAGVALRSIVGTGVLVQGDRVRLEQVFMNVLTNALKYTPRGGSATLEMSAAEGRAQVRVTDTGIGIDKEMLGHVFDLFAQADRTLDRSQGGLGIGLTLARSLISLHGGTVAVTSPGLGRGTELTIRLPRVAGSEAEVDERRVPSPSAAPAATKVVLVEDGEDIREMLQELLQLEGHSVWTAESGPVGVERILEVQPDIAFVDIGLPGFDGYEVARRVRASGARLPLVALTGYGQQEDRRMATDAGFDAHIAKPVEIAEINSALAALVGP